MSGTDGGGGAFGSWFERIWSTQRINGYDDFGIPNANNFGRYQYTGQAWLADVGMYYYKARMYSPTLGRFMQTDPIGYGDGLNIYNYVHADPVNRRDPSGLDGDIVSCGSGCPPYNGGGPLLAFATLAGSPGPIRPRLPVVRSLLRPQNNKPEYCSNIIHRNVVRLSQLATATQNAGKVALVAGGVGILTGVFAPEGVISVGVGVDFIAYGGALQVAADIGKAAVGDFSGTRDLAQFAATVLADLSPVGEAVVGSGADLVPSPPTPCK